jgi:cutinase
MFVNLQLVLLTLLGLNAFASPVPAPTEVEVTKRGAGLNEFLNTLLDHLPIVSQSLVDGTSVITTFDKLLGALTGAQETYNEAEGACKEWTVVFARGTAEPGNVSSRIWIYRKIIITDKCSSPGRSPRWATLV